MGRRAGADGGKGPTGATVHVTVATLGHMLVLHVTPSDEPDWAQVTPRSTAGTSVVLRLPHRRDPKVDYPIPILLAKHSERLDSSCTSTGYDGKSGITSRANNSIWRMAVAISRW